MDVDIRKDKNLAFLLQYENIAWYENGLVKILDRRVYPYKEEYVYCKNYNQIIDALRNMVTQSGGPYLAAAMGMVLATYQAKKEGKNIVDFVTKAAVDIANARPTTREKMYSITQKSLERIKKAYSEGKDVIDAAFSFAIENANERYGKIEQMAKYLVEKFPNNSVIMTQCFAEVIVGMMAKECYMQNKKVRFICPETRPYLQGARLTASVLSDMGYKVNVITDNMPGYIMQREKVDCFTSAADVITMDGNIVNKIGTFQIALSSIYNHIPYYVTGVPNIKHPDISSVKIENRNYEDVINWNGIRLVKEKVEAYYPAFDITPPELCSGIVTDKGIYAPRDVAGYWRNV